MPTFSIPLGKTTRAGKCDIAANLLVMISLVDLPSSSDRLSSSAYTNLSSHSNNPRSRTCKQSGPRHWWTSNTSKFHSTFGRKQSDDSEQSFFPSVFCLFLAISRAFVTTPLLWTFDLRVADIPAWKSLKHSAKQSHVWQGRFEGI